MRRPVDAPVKPACTGLGGGQKRRSGRTYLCRALGCRRSNSLDRALSSARHREARQVSRCRSLVRGRMAGVKRIAEACSSCDGVGITKHSSCAYLLNAAYARLALCDCRVLITVSGVSGLRRCVWRASGSRWSLTAHWLTRRSKPHWLGPF